MRGLSSILALGFGVTSVVSGIGIPRAYPPEQHGSEVLRRADNPACVNNETNRQCWDGPYGTYNITTDYYNDTPDTGAIVEVLISLCALLMAVLVDCGQRNDVPGRSLEKHVSLQQFLPWTTDRGKLGRHTSHSCKEQSTKQRV